MQKYSAAETVVVRRTGEMNKRVAVAAALLLAVVACAAIAMSYSTQPVQPNVESMYHMWLGPNGLPLSPRKQRGLLFQFCTTNFVSPVLCALHRVVPLRRPTVIARSSRGAAMASKGIGVNLRRSCTRRPMLLLLLNIFCACGGSSSISVSNCFKRENLAGHHCEQVRVYTHFTEDETFCGEQCAISLFAPVCLFAPIFQRLCLPPVCFCIVGD